MDNLSSTGGDSNKVVISLTINAQLLDPNFAMTKKQLVAMNRVMPKLFAQAKSKLQCLSKLAPDSSKPERWVDVQLPQMMILFWIPILPNNLLKSKDPTVNVSDSSTKLILFLGIHGLLEKDSKVTVFVTEPIVLPNVIQPCKVVGDSWLVSPLVKTLMCAVKPNK